MDLKVKAKVDGKYMTFGNVSEGKYGPRLGLKKSPELMALFNAAGDGEWVNLSLFENDGGGRQQTEPQGRSRPGPMPPLNDEIPFMRCDL